MPIDERTFETLKLEYVALRAEILQSISYQHQILLAGYGATGAFISYVLVKLPSQSFFDALVATPFILLGMASLWIVECNRMVRASYYIGRILWRDLQKDGPKAGTSAEWEVWIRSEVGEASCFRKRQDRSQHLVVCRGPIFLSLITSGLAIINAFVVHQGSLRERLVPYGLLLIAALAFFLWRRLHHDLCAISDLAATPIPDRATELKTDATAVLAPR